jgi:enoyl-CoA hydratase
MQTHTLLEIHDDVAQIILSADTVGKPPTLDHVVLDELSSQIASIRQKTHQLRAVVVRSVSSKYFVVGANIDALQTLDSQTIIPWIQHGHQVFNELAALPLPVIARVEGFALGGGLELALSCDVIVASETARLGQPEATLGFVAGWGGSFRLPRRIGPGRAKHLFFTGKILEAKEAFALGLVDLITSPESLDAAIDSIIKSVRQASPISVKHLKRLVDHSFDISLDESFLDEAVASCECIVSQDTRDRVAKFLENRQKR